MSINYATPIKSDQITNILNRNKQRLVKIKSDLNYYYVPKDAPSKSNAKAIWHRTTGNYYVDPDFFNIPSPQRVKHTTEEMARARLSHNQMIGQNHD